MNNRNTNLANSSAPVDSHRRFELEVCVDRVGDAMTAIAAGATRIEMNASLELDGLTPPPQSCLWLKENCGAPVLAMLRPHHRSFTYSLAEETNLLRDCETLLAVGVDGIVFGSLDDSGNIAVPILRKVISLCGERELVFHRAFDALTDQLRGLEQLIECGVKRVLTSGGAETALSGASRLRELVDRSAERIEILPGGGVNSQNVAQILGKTRCTQIHGSFRSLDPRSGPDPDDIRATREVMAKMA